LWKHDLQAHHSRRYRKNRRSGDAATPSRLPWRSRQSVVASVRSVVLRKHGRERVVLLLRRPESLDGCRFRAQRGQLSDYIGHDHAS
jgi:hypothetical protein